MSFCLSRTQCIGGDVYLKWTTASETNNFGFDIERKLNTQWQKIGFIEGQGTTLQPQEYEFIDENIEVGTYRYRLKQIDTNGSFEYSPILSVTVGGPVTSRLAQNYPNPFNPSTNIIYSIEEDGFVQLEIYNILGHLISTLIQTNKSAGDIH